MRGSSGLHRHPRLSFLVPPSRKATTLPRITQFYGITDGSVPFFDADVTTDNRWFVDPYAIRIAREPEPFVTAANACTSSFFDTLAGCIAAPTGSKSHADGLTMLQRFTEPRETRLGMAAFGFNGHGGAQLVGAGIWEALNTDAEALVEVAVLGRLEHIPLFVEGVDKDITSDLTTRVIYKPLADFTAAMIDQYPQFKAPGREVVPVSRQVWDAVGAKWANQIVELPAVNGKPLLLVPAGWVRQHLLMSATRFYETTALSYAQLQRAVTLKGKLVKTPKAELKRSQELSRGRATNLRLARQAQLDGTNLVAEFTRFVNERLK